MQSLTKSLSQTNWCFTNKRYLFKWLTIVFNNVDQNMIKELGSEVAAAQWIVRNGGTVQFSRNKSASREYDQLLQDPSLKNDSILEIDATKSSIHHAGFPYLKNLKSLQKLVFNETKYLEDHALVLLGQYNLPTLKHLEIINCPDITDVGIKALKRLNSLSILKLQGLSSVNDKASCTDTLSRSLKNCKINWD